MACFDDSHQPFNFQEALKHSLDALTQVASGQQSRDEHKNRYIFWETQPVAQFGETGTSTSQVCMCYPTKECLDPAKEGCLSDLSGLGKQECKEFHTRSMSNSSTAQPAHHGMQD